VACKVLAEKILEVRDQHSIVKTFFVTAGVQNIGIGIAILVFFIAFSNFHIMKIPMVNLKSFTLV
jgi:cell division protein FtsX